ncbi:MAG: succinate dehydrogenase assembly factor 2 [Gammaproteobacteria bacterium]|nr:succinate dehydrogenase assembly factor 2 [Gammaproteobacteria bacterium]
MDKNQLRWRCRRGMRELDEAMLAYIDHHFDSATKPERELFVELLSLQDPTLFRLITGKDTDEHFQPLVDKITQTLQQKAAL